MLYWRQKRLWWAFAAVCTGEGHVQGGPKNRTDFYHASYASSHVRVKMILPKIPKYFNIIVITVVIIALTGFTMYTLTDLNQASPVQLASYDCVFHQRDQTQHQLWQSPPNCTRNPNTCTNSNKQMVTRLLRGVTMWVLATHVFIFFDISVTKVQPMYKTVSETCHFCNVIQEYNGICSKI